MRRFASVFKRKCDDHHDHHDSSASSAAAESTCSSSTSSSRSQPRWKAWLTPKRAKTPRQQAPQPVSRHAPPSAHDSDYVFVDNDPQTPANPLPVSPFVRNPSGALFPRSVNSSATLPPSYSLRVNLLKSNLAHHPSSSDQPALPPQSANPASRHNTIPPPSDIDIPYPPKATHIYSASLGLRRWIARPCFEERNLVHLPTNHGIHPLPISASRAVAALEYSEYLDVMVDPDLTFAHSHSTIDSSIPDFSSQQSHASVSDLPAVPPVTPRASYTTTPSPLRIEHSSSLVPSQTPKQPLSPRQAPPVVKPKTDVKRVVRFAEDDDEEADDGLPLHIIRMRKKREEKALFLRAEQARREQQERAERHRLEIERRRQEQEAKERERRRLEKEMEKREREAALYAEAVAATRLRREAQRAGGIPSASNSSTNLLPPSPSFTSLRESERNRSYSDIRPDTRRSATMPIPRKDPLDLHLNLRVQSDPPSPGSSRPPSLAHSPASPATFGPNSRPPSTYSSSSEDARQSRRHSAMTSPFPAKPTIVSYPTWSGSNPNLHYVPPVPMFPNYIHDMPLLPPAAPFMKSYDKRSSRGSSPGHSSTASSRRGSFNSSTERVNIMKSSPASKSTSTIAKSPQQQYQHYQGSPSSSPRRSEFGKDTHQRWSSNDSKPKAPPSSYLASPRGRQASTPSSPHPQQQQYIAPNPWTALPTQNGVLPYAMPVSSYTHLAQGSGRRDGSQKVAIS